MSATSSQGIEFHVSQIELALTYELILNPLSVEVLSPSGLNSLCSTGTFL
jgi:hypothetical protein